MILNPVRLPLLTLIAVLLPVILGGCGDDQKSSSPVIDVTPDALVRAVPFGVGTAGIRIQVRNSGDGDLRFRAHASVGDWCYLWDDGEIDEFVATAPDSFAVVFSTALLQAGVFYDTVWIESAQAVNSPVAIPITITITNRLQLDPDSLLFQAVTGGSNPPPQSLIVGAASNVPLDFTLSSSSSWLRFDPDFGTTWMPVQVSADIQSLVPGVYYDTLVVQASMAQGPGRLPVRLEIASWLRNDRDSKFDLLAVCFPSSERGVTVGKFVGDEGGVIFGTDDGAVTWDSLLDQTISPIEALGDVYFADERHGWAVGRNAFIYYTGDGGETWSRQNPPDSNMTAGLNAVYFIDTLRGWAVGNDGVVISTQNGGADWQAENSGTGNSLTGVWFTDALQGWIVGNYGLIRSTSNGGSSWQTQAAGLVVHDLWDVTFADNQSGWIVGNEGAVLRTTNGGQTWTLQTRSTTESLWAVAFVSPARGWAVGTGGVILRTDDGVTWRQQASGVTTNLHDVFFIDENNGWICGSRGILLHTIAGGD